MAEGGASSFLSSRIALIAAAIIAALGVGTAVWRSEQAAAPAPSPAVAIAPDAATLTAQLEARLKSHPQDATGWSLLGDAHYTAGRYAEATMAYRNAARLAPQSAQAWSSLGEALALAGAGTIAPDARTAFRHALERDPGDPRARYYLAVARDMDGDHNGAIDAWFALLKSSPADAPWVADVRKAIGDVGKKNGIDVAPRLAAVQPSPPIRSIATAAIPGPSPEAMRAASAMPRGAQDAMVTQMVEGLAAKLSANPKNPDGWIMLMRSRVTLGQSVQAAAALRSAIAANPADAARLNAAARELGIAA